MKAQILIAIALSLSACATAPLATIPPATQQSAVRSPARESIRVQLPFATGFRTQLARYQELDQIRFSVSGQGISGSVTNSTDVTVDYDSDVTSATLRNIPVENGAWRVVTAVGLDSEGQELHSFTAKAVYRSDDDVSSHTLDFDRTGLLLARGLEVLIANDETEVLDDLDEDEWLELEDEAGDAADYDDDANHFYNEDGDFVDPMGYDAGMIAEAIKDGILLEEEVAAAELDTTALSFILEAEDGNGLAGDIVVTLDDPSSRYQQFRRLSFEGEFDLEDVTPGIWTLKAYDSTGELLDAAEVEIDMEGSVVGDTPTLTVPGVDLLP